MYAKLRERSPSLDNTRTHTNEPSTGGSIHEHRAACTGTRMCVKDNVRTKYCAFHLKWMAGLYKQHTFSDLPKPAITCHGPLYIYAVTNPFPMKTTSHPSSISSSEDVIMLRQVWAGFGRFGQVLAGQKKCVVCTDRSSISNEKHNRNLPLTAVGSYIGCASSTSKHGCSIFPDLPTKARPCSSSC